MEIKKHQKSVRLGIALSSIQSGTAFNVWVPLAQKAEQAGMSVFVFPGGQLGEKENLDIYRNSIYKLITKKNLDALVCWSSNICHSLTTEEADAFHKSFEPLPFITLFQKAKDHPEICYDSYDAEKSLIDHFVIEHKACHIAFLRGPKDHTVAAERYKGYCDALSENHIKYDDVLVSSPCEWDKGETACRELIEDRRLIPGRDFDTLIGSSDLMIFSAVRYLESIGYTVPDQYHAAGFNNNTEGKLLPVRLTTVSMPYEAVTQKSVEIITDIVSGKTSIELCKDVVLQCDLVIRESCGCTAKDVACFEQSKEIERYLLQKHYDRDKWSKAINDLKCDLLGARSRRYLFERLEYHLPRIGITTFALVLYHSSKKSLCVGYFSSSQKREMISFPAENILPREFESDFNKGVYLVQSVFNEQQSLGYIVFNVPFFYGIILHDIGQTISSALKGIALFDDTEKAERQKRELYTAMCNTLYNPFADIIEGFEQIQNLNNDAHKKDLMLQKLKDMAVTRQNEMNILIDNSFPKLEKIENKTSENKKLKIIFISNTLRENEFNSLFALMMSDFPDTFQVIRSDLSNLAVQETPDLIITGDCSINMLDRIRQTRNFEFFPVAVITKSIGSFENLSVLCKYPHLFYCHYAVCESHEIITRFRAIAQGAEILPMYKGSFVKKTLYFFEQHASSQFSRLKIADYVHISEDYLSKIFREDMGISPWDYLIRYRLYSSRELLRNSSLQISAVAEQTGFGEQAYFARVFHRIVGMTPSQYKDQYATKK